MKAKWKKAKQYMEDTFSLITFTILGNTKMELDMGKENMFTQTGRLKKESLKTVNLLKLKMFKIINIEIIIYFKQNK